MMRPALVLRVLMWICEEGVKNIMRTARDGGLFPLNDTIQNQKAAPKLFPYQPYLTSPSTTNSNIFVILTMDNHHHYDKEGLGPQECDILHHARRHHIHVKRVVVVQEGHDIDETHVWHCFDCSGLTTTTTTTSPQTTTTTEHHHHEHADPKVLDSDEKMKHHLMETHGVSWYTF